MPNHAKVVVHKNVFRDCVKYVAMQHCHIAKWHDGLKRSRKAGKLFRTTSVQDDPKSRTKQFNSLLPCWMLIADGLCVSCQVATDNSPEFLLVSELCQMTSMRMRDKIADRGIWR